MATSSSSVAGMTASASRAGNLSAKLILPGATIRRHASSNAPHRRLSLSKNQPQHISAKAGEGPLDNDAGKQVKKAAQETRKAGEDLGSRVKEGTENARQEAGAKLNEAYNKAGDAAEQTKHNTQNVAEKVRDVVKDRANDVRGGAENIKDRVVDAAETVKDKILEGKDRAAETLKDIGK